MGGWTWLLIAACSSEPDPVPVGRIKVITPPRERLLAGRAMTDIGAQHLDTVALVLGVSVEEAAARGPAAWRAAGVDDTVAAGAGASLAFRALARQRGVLVDAEPPDAQLLTGLPSPERAADLDVGDLRAYRAGSTVAWVGAGLIVRSDRPADLGRMTTWLGGGRTVLDPEGFAWLAAFFLDASGHVATAEEVAEKTVEIPRINVPSGQVTLETEEASYRFWLVNGKSSHEFLVSVPRDGLPTITQDPPSE